MTRRDGLLDFRWDYIFACFALVFFSFVFAREILAFHTSFVHPDFRLFYAFRQWFSYRLLSGEFPLWNPYWGIGGPAEAWATIPIDLYTVLERFFGPQYHVFQWFQLLLLLGTGFYAFLKLGFKPMIAVFGCILFFMTPWVTYFYFYFMKPHSFIFLPLIFVFIHEWTRTGRRGYFFLTCWAVILSMFGTKPEFWFYQTAYFLFFCILGGLTYREGAWPNAIRRMGGGMLAIGIGLMAQAWQIHLLTQIMKSADRSLEHGLGNLVRWEMWQHLGQSFFEWDLTRLSALGVPFFLGVMVHRQRFKNALGLIGVIVFLWLKGWTDPLLLSFLRSPVLIGTVAGMVLIVLSHLRRKWIWGQFIKTGFVYLLFIYYWCRPERGDLGEMEVIRSAPFVFKTLLSALVWVGCWEFWNNKLVRLAYFSILFVLVMRLQGQILLAYLSGLLWIPTRDNYLIDFGIVVIGVVGLTRISISVPLNWRHSKAIKEIWLPLACIGGIVFSAGTNFYYSHPFMQKTPKGLSHYTGIPMVREVIRSLRQTPEARIYLDYDNAWGFTYGMGACLLEGVGEVTQYSSFNPKNYKDWTVYRRLGIRPEENWGGYPNEYSLKTISYLPRQNMLGRDNSEIYSYTLMLRPPMDRVSLALLGVSHVLVVSSFEKGNAEKLGLRNEKDWGVGYPGMEGSLHSAEVDNPMPRAFMLYGLQGAKVSELKNEMDPIIDGDRIRTKSGEFEFSPAVIEDYQPEKVFIRAEAKEPGYLVLSDLFHPFWHARVDGAETAIVLAFSIFRAIPLSAGQHRIEFYCEVPGLRGMVLFSLLVIFALLVANYLFVRKKAIRHG